MAEKTRFYVTEKLSENISETPEGFLVCENVPITRIGEFVYKASEVPVQADSSGMVRIQRDEEEVFSENTIKSFEGKPVTIDHPQEPVTPDNWSNLAHGTAINVRRGQNGQGGYLIADLLITTQKAIELVRSGLREVSCGYDANYEQIIEGYGRQKDIIGNHVALVMRGRAGGRCAIADKTCDGCGNCKCTNDKKAEEEVTEMGIKEMKDRVKKWLDSCPVKDADESEEEEKARKEKEAADAKSAKDAKDQEDLPKKLEDIKDTYDKLGKIIKDVESGKLDASQLPVKLEELSLDRKARDQGEEDDPDKKKKDEISASDKKMIVDLSKTVADLKGIVGDLVTASDTARAAMDQKIKDAEAAEKAEEAKKVEEEKKGVEDSWPEIVHRAEVLSPGMKLQKPVKDHSKIAREVKLNALKGAYTRDEESKTAVAVFVKDGDFSKLTSDNMVDVAFIGASEMIAKNNNKKVQSSSIITKDFGGIPATVRHINEANKKFYQKKVA